MGKTQTAAPPEDSRNMEDTLAALNIDKDALPEDVAADGAMEVASSVVVEEAKIEIPPAPEDKKVSEEEVVASLPEPDPDPPPLVPAPKPQKPRKRETAKGAASRVGKALAAKVPGGESVKVSKRKEDGKLWYVNTFTTADLHAHDSFDSFLTEYVKPTHGAGEYVLTAPDPRDPTKEFELGVVRLLGGTKGQSGDQGVMGVVQTILAQTQSRDADWLERMEKMNQPQQQQNPLELLQGVMDLNERVNGKAGEGEAVAKAEAASSTKTMMDVMQSSGDKTMQMMMMMQQQAQAAAAQQQQMMMTLLAKPKEEDPMLKLLLMKLVKDDESGGAMVAPPPPPPPPPQMDMVALLTALTGFMGAMGGDGGGGDDDFKEFLKTQLAQNANQGLSMKEMVELITAKDGAKGDGFKDAVDNMAAIMNITNNVSRQNEGGPAAGLFDALAALFSNRDFAGAIANTIRAKTDQSGAVQKTGIDMAQQRLAMQQRLALRQQQQAALAKQQGSVVTPAPTAGGPPVETTPLITDEQQRMAEAAAQQRQLPELPSDTHTHINKIATAADDAERVERTVRMLIYFAEFEQWRAFVEKTLGYIRDGNRKGTMEYLGAFFEGFATIHLVDPTLGKEILRSISDHFEALRDQLRDFELAGDRMVTGADLLEHTEDGEDISGGHGKNDADAGDDDAEDLVDLGGEPVDPGENDEGDDPT